MSQMQISFDFFAETIPLKHEPRIRRRPPKIPSIAVEAERERSEAAWKKADAEARAYWSAGMVTSLPCFCTVLDSKQTYTQMLPGVVESTSGDTATVRIYASPEYGYTIENYALHRKLAIDVPLHQLGRYHGNRDLERLVMENKLATGCPMLAAEVRMRPNYRMKI